MEKISIDMIPRGINPVVNLSQYDEGREICLALFENGSSFELDGSEVLELNILKPDGTVIAETLPSVSGDLVLFETTQNMTDVAGSCIAKLRIDGVGGSAFILNIEPMP